MSLATSSLDRAEAPLFTDGIGDRVVAADPSTGELLQILRLRQALTAVPSFEFALRERTARLMNFRHAYYARVRRIDRTQAGGGLAVVSDHVEGTRLSEILRVAYERGLQLDTNAALCLIRQLVPAVALLHENARDASHGLIAPERVVVTPHARLVVVEHVIGSAVEQLQFGRERLWQEFRVAVPPSAGVARFDHRADVNGIGITALSLVLGRPLRADEFPHAIPQLLMQAKERSPMGDERPLSNAFRNWLGRTLQLDVRRAFASAPEALAALEETVASDPSYVATPVALETFLSQYIATVLEPPAPAPLPAAPAPVAPAPVAAAPTLRSAAPAVVPPAVVSIAAARVAEPRPMAEPAKAEEPQAEVIARLHDLPTLDELIPVHDLKAPDDRLARRSLGEGGRVTPQPVRPVEAPRVSPAERPRPVPAAVEIAPVHVVEPAANAVELVRASEAFEETDEAGPAADSAPVAAAAQGRSRKWLVVAGLVLVLLAAGAFYATRILEGGAAPSLGTLNVQSSPAGVEVFVDGVSRGMTPTSVSLAAGSHILELRGRGVPRVIPLQVPAGGQVSQYLEFAESPLTGMLVVHSQPAGAKVSIDGIPRGVAPMTIEGLSSGDHEVVLQNETGSSRHVVKVLAGTTASLVAPVSATPTEGPVSGWVSVKAPFTIEIREDGKLIGTTETDRIMLASGRHVLEFSNQALGYREARAVQVVPGKIAPVEIELPKGSVNLNAAPWAEVWIDGRKVGDTPIGNLEVPIGPHEIVFRHPELGEKKHAISVTTAAPVRLSVSMR